MKRIVFITLILMLFVALVSCGGKAASTTAATTTVTTAAPVATTPIETTQTLITTKPTETTFVNAPETTLPETTPMTTAPDTTPVELEPTSISYSMREGAYFYTQFDEAGRTAVRYLYDRDTMQKTEKEYRYTYDESGKLATFAIWNGNLGVQFDIAYGEDGNSLIATDVTDESYQYEIAWDENGKIISETILENGVVAFSYEYNPEGFVVMEAMYFRGLAIEYETFYDGDTAMITCALSNAETELCVTYNEWGYPIALEGHQLSNEYWHLYTYTRKMLCATATCMDEGYEFYYEFTYDEYDRVIKVIEESDDGITEEEFTYDEHDRVLRSSLKLSEHSGEVNYFYVTVNEYDENGNVIKMVCYEDGDETSYISKWVFSYTYNEAGLLIADTADYIKNPNGFIASYKDTYEYDELGREIKFTMVEYNKNGSVMNTTVYETIYAEDGTTAKEIVSYYNAAGILTNQDVKDYTT